MTLVGLAPNLFAVLSILLVRRAGKYSQPLWLSILLAGVNPSGLRRHANRPLAHRAGPYDRNPRLNDGPAVEAVAASL